MVIKSLRSITRYAVLTSFLLSLGMEGCKKDEEPENTNPQEYIISADVVRLEDNTLNSLSSMDTSGTLIFPQNTQDLQQLRQGSIIVSKPVPAAPYGFIKKVETITVDNGQVILTTKNASLTEVFSKLNLDETFDLEPGQLTKDGSGVEGFYLEVDTALYDEDGDYTTEDDQIRLDGNIELDPSLHIEVRIDNFTLKEFRFWAQLDEALECNVSITKDILSYEKEITLYMAYLNPIVLFIGWVPVVLCPQIDFVAGAEVSIEASISSGIEQSASMKAGAEYVNNAWSPISECTKDFSFIPPTLSVGAEAKGYLGPKIQLLLYGLVGPQADINTYLRLDADLFANPWWSLYGGLSAGVGIDMELIGQVNIGYHADLLEYEILLAQAQGSANQPPTALFTVSPATGDTSTVFQFDASASYDGEDPPGDLQVQWDWNHDGIWDTPYSTLKQEGHKFLQSGSHTVAMQVKDSGGLTDTVSHVVIVTGGGSSGTPCPGVPTVTDPDGHVYNTVLVGDQCWMKENLNYNTGNSWCYNNSPSNCGLYGRLYVYTAAVMACPAGWHLPTDPEWKTLEIFLGMDAAQADLTGWRGTDQGTQLKQGGTSGFEALMAGVYNLGFFSDLGTAAYFWTSSSENASTSWTRMLNQAETQVGRYTGLKDNGISVRCILD
jgi:uncharacterized protein (TIGR02145 family)